MLASGICMNACSCSHRNRRFYIKTGSQSICQNPTDTNIPHIRVWLTHDSFACAFCDNGSASSDTETPTKPLLSLSDSDTSLESFTGVLASDSDVANTGSFVSSNYSENDDVFEPASGQIEL